MLCRILVLVATPSSRPAPGSSSLWSRNLGEHYVTASMTIIKVLTKCAYFEHFDTTHQWSTAVSRKCWSGPRQPSDTTQCSRRELPAFRNTSFGP